MVLASNLDQKEELREPLEADIVDKFRPWEIVCPPRLGHCLSNSWTRENPQIFRSLQRKSIPPEEEQC